MLHRFPFRISTQWAIPSRYFCNSSIIRTFSSATGQHTPYNVCIVGSGPSGFYTAKYLLRDDPDVHVDVLDMMPTPFGLVRSGVAPDHPEVKNVTNDFESVAENDRFQFLGNIKVGEDVQLADLQKAYDAVVLAYGASSDRSLSIPGESLRGVLSARAFVNWYNGHPDSVDLSPDLSVTDVVIIGQGNVALDCARVLTADVEELAKTDIASYAVEALRQSKVERVWLLGRRGHVQAAFTMKELRELSRLETADLVVFTKELEKGRNEASLEEIAQKRAKKRMDHFLEDQAHYVESLNLPLPAPSKTLTAPSPPPSASGARKQNILRFFVAPSAFLPAPNSESVAGVQVHITELKGEAGRQSAVPTDEVEVIPCGMVLKSIGYKSEPLLGLPFDSKSGTVPSISGRVLAAPDNATASAADTEAGAATIPHLYVTGWLRRGPSGIIGTNITDAAEVVKALLADKAQRVQSECKGEVEKGETPAQVIKRIVMENQNGDDDKVVTDWDGWLRISDKEVADGEALGKYREKIVRVPEMIETASGEGN